jgi:hypothetical protein
MCLVAAAIICRGLRYDLTTPTTVLGSPAMNTFDSLTAKQEDGSHDLGGSESALANRIDGLPAF